MGVTVAARTFQIPKSTLLRRLRTNNAAKEDRLGPPSLLGGDAERKLVGHIKKLQKTGFAPTRDEVRMIAFNLAERLGIKHNFDKDEGKIKVSKYSVTKTT